MIAFELQVDRGKRADGCEIGRFEEPSEAAALSRLLAALFFDKSSFIKNIPLQ